jgi:hypothetical protein
MAVRDEAMILPFFIFLRRHRQPATLSRSDARPYNELPLSDFPVQ